MSWSLNIGSVAGTAVRVHVTFLLFLAWIFGVNYFSGGAQAAWSGLLFIVLLFLCVLSAVPSIPKDTDTLLCFAAGGRTTMNKGNHPAATRSVGRAVIYARYSC